MQSDKGPERGVMSTDEFTLSLPEEEARRLLEAYKNARVILEYGSGGSTVLASRLESKLVFSVESDRNWALRLQNNIDRNTPSSLTTVYHVDIGPTGSWGRPLDNSSWDKYHNYPVRIWDEPFFRHPDVILIDGRFRPACFVTACMRIEKPITVLFDDYVNRPAYSVIENLAKPKRLIGRMAEFAIEPRAFQPSDLSLLLSLVTKSTLAGKPTDYSH